MNNPMTVIRFEQPIGTFYLSTLPASVLIQIAEVKQREYTDHEPNEGEQRDLSEKRAKEIARYASNPDATFPTPIILAIEEGTYSLTAEPSLLTLNEGAKVKVLDGQHRLRGLELAGEEVIALFELPVVFVIEPTQEECAYIFSIINSTQTRVSPSLIYDLFEVSRHRSPQKTGHEIARSLNSDEESPFYKRLKMLGKGGGPLASISQASFIKFLIENITRKPNEYLNAIKQSVELEPEDLPFNSYFRESKDVVIRKILLNLFRAVETEFGEEWNNPNEYVLSKAIGYGGLLKALPDLLKKGKAKGELNEEYFQQCMCQFRMLLDAKGLELTSQHFSSNEQGRTKLAHLITESQEN